MECIKHLFSVEGVVFVLAVDEAQLRYSVAGVYGERHDGEGYLKKFIDWGVRLPAPKSKEYAAFLYEHFDLKNTGRFIEGTDIHKGRESLLHPFALFSEVLGLTLRQQSHCFTDINITIRSLDEKSSPLVQSLAIVATLREAFPNEIKDYSLGKKPIEDLLNKLDPLFADKEPWFRHFYGSWKRFRAVLHVLFLDEQGFSKRVSKAPDMQRERSEFFGACIQRKK